MTNDDIVLCDEDERPFPDSDKAITALQDVAVAVDVLLATIAEQRLEIKRLRAEREEADYNNKAFKEGTMK